MSLSGILTHLLIKVVHGTSETPRANIDTEKERRPEEFGLIKHFGFFHKSLPPRLPFSISDATCCPKHLHKLIRVLGEKKTQETLKIQNVADSVIQSDGESSIFIAGGGREHIGSLLNIFRKIFGCVRVLHLNIRLLIGLIEGMQHIFCNKANIKNAYIGSFLSQAKCFFFFCVSRWCKHLLKNDSLSIFNCPFCLSPKHVLRSGVAALQLQTDPTSAGCSETKSQQAKKRGSSSRRLGGGGVGAMEAPLQKQSSELLVELLLKLLADAVQVRRDDKRQPGVDVPDRVHSPAPTQPRIKQ